MMHLINHTMLLSITFCMEYRRRNKRSLNLVVVMVLWCTYHRSSRSSATLRIKCMNRLLMSMHTTIVNVTRVRISIYLLFMLLRRSRIRLLHSALVHFSVTMVIVLEALWANVGVRAKILALLNFYFLTHDFTLIKTSCSNSAWEVCWEIHLDGHYNGNFRDSSSAIHIYSTGSCGMWNCFHTYTW